MSEVTFFVAMPFGVGEHGPVPFDAVACTSAYAAVTRAESLARRPEHIGALAFSRSGDPAVGEFGDATVLRTFGDVPSDLSAL